MRTRRRRWHRWPPALDAICCHRLRQRDNEIRIVIACIPLVSPEIDHLKPSCAKTIGKCVSGWKRSTGRRFHRLYCGPHNVLGSGGLTTRT
jgi:hypothetical protein